MIKIPWLLLHGIADDVVLPADTQLVQRLLGDAASVVMVEDGDHSFSQPESKRQATDSIVPWLRMLP